MFYNTTNIEGATLKAARQSAGSLESKVLKFFQFYKKCDFTAEEIHEGMEMEGWINVNQYPLNSIRRAITDLTTAGKLERTDMRRVGKWGKLAYSWRVK